MFSRAVATLLLPLQAVGKTLACLRGSFLPLKMRAYSSYNKMDRRCVHLLCDKLLCVLCCSVLFKKSAPRRKCAACKIVVHTACIEELDKVSGSRNISIILMQLINTPSTDECWRLSLQTDIRRMMKWDERV